MWQQIDRFFFLARTERIIFYIAFVAAHIAYTLHEQFENTVMGRPFAYWGLIINLGVLIVFSFYLRKYSTWLPSYIWPAFIVMLHVSLLSDAYLGYTTLIHTSLEPDTMRHLYTLMALCGVGIIGAVVTAGILVFGLIREAGDRNVSDEELSHRYTRHAMAHFSARSKYEADSTYELLSLDFMEMERRDPELDNLAPLMKSDDPAVRFISARQLLGMKDESAIPVLEECAQREDLIGVVAKSTLESVRAGTIKFWASNPRFKRVTATS